MKKIQMGKVCAVDEWLLLIVIGLLATINPVTAVADEMQGKADTPTMELLEFLADFETDDGRWVDPSELEGMVETRWSGTEEKPEAEADE